MNITLIGMKHCGKTTLGTALAVRWRCPFYDVDQMIEERHAGKTGERLTVRAIFQQQGEQRFHELETQVVCDLYLRLGDAAGHHVIAVGGRTALNTKVDELLSALGLIVYLEVSPEEMFARVQCGGLPPFVDEQDPMGHFATLYTARAPHYQRLANLTVNLDGLDSAAALEKLCRELDRLHQTQGR
jgi:shikimate kinase